MREEFYKFLDIYTLFSMPNHNKIMNLKGLIDKVKDSDDLEEIYKKSGKINAFMRKYVEPQHPIHQAWNKFMMCLMKGKYGGYYEIYGNEEVIR